MCPTKCSQRPTHIFCHHNVYIKARNVKVCSIVSYHHHHHHKVLPSAGAWTLEMPTLKFNWLQFIFRWLIALFCYRTSVKCVRMSSMWTFRSFLHVTDFQPLFASPVCTWNPRDFHRNWITDIWLSGYMYKQQVNVYSLTNFASNFNAASDMLALHHPSGKSSWKTF